MLLNENKMAERRGVVKRKQEEQSERAKLAQTLKAKKAKKRQAGKMKDEQKAKGVEARSSILNVQEMIVQQLESEPSGVAMKYKKTGPQEFVEEFSNENIKKARACFIMIKDCQGHDMWYFSWTKWTVVYQTFWYYKLQNHLYQIYQGVW